MSEQTKTIMQRIAQTASPLKRQLLMLACITKELRERGKPAPVLIGGCALAYYSREVYFTADIDLAYADREALGEVLIDLGFVADGRFWVHHDLQLVVEALRPLRCPAKMRHGRLWSLRTDLSAVSSALKTC